ncbi:MAG: Ku protein [Acidimicrobiales bacterium]
MARSIWGGAISFGLVNVPVKLFTAVRKKDVRFHQLHRPDGARINQKRVCSNDGDEVAYEDIVKGYEIAKGQYVVIEPEELEALDPESTHTIDIEDFVQLDQIDPLFFDASYYVVPDSRGEKAYRLLLESMKEAGKVGIARVVMRTKQYLVAIRPVEDVLVMSTMNFADEVVPESELDGLPGSSANVSDRELTMAKQLIESLSTDFDPGKYQDTYREKVLELIEQKAEGKEVVAQPEPKAATPVVDLMAALEASLAAAKGEKKAAKADGKDGGKGKDSEQKAS